MTKQSHTSPLGPGPVPFPIYQLTVEVATAKLVAGLRDAGVRPLVLKGPSIERWIFDADEHRLSSDVDLLVSPAELARAEAHLKELGLVNRYDGPSPGWAEEHADNWRGDGWLVPLDLHRRLWGLEAAPIVVWDQLWSTRTQMKIGGTTCDILGEPARALGLALHAAHHGVERPRPIDDLKRALTRLDPTIWRDAVALAFDLGGDVGLRAGLGLIPEGQALLDELDLTPADPAEISVVPKMWAVPPTAEGFIRLRQARGPRAKLRLLFGEIFPSREFMRTRSEHGTLARRGTRGLLASYPRRWATLIVETPRGIWVAFKLRNR